MTDDRFRPFHCGTQFGDWTMSNCDRCKLGASPTAQSFDEIACDIERALAKAYMLDGTVSRRIADRMGAIEHDGHYTWMCGEWDPTEEWKAEKRLRDECGSGEPPARWEMREL